MQRPSSFERVNPRHRELRGEEEIRGEKKSCSILASLASRARISLRSSVGRWVGAKKNLAGVKRGACPRPRLPTMGGEASSSQRPPLADSEQACEHDRARAAGVGLG